ncbi:porin [Paraburkholderia adhaesiva]|uniref:porin n=1 Tax=Paraburkholderia adhaesiva TaxID=2883244 RepID=UPI001F1B7731|nr:porin [Paraburkholderia adhaesiva]
MKSSRLLIGEGIVLLAGLSTWGGGLAYAQALPDSNKTEIQELRQQLAALSKRLDELTANQSRSTAQGTAQIQKTSSMQSAQALPAPALPATTYAQATEAAPGAAAEQGSSDWGHDMPPRVKQVLAALGNMEFYGNLDLSVDYATKGLQSSYVRPDGTRVFPQGNMGWMPDVSSNLSYIGVRGKHDFGSPQFSFIYQLETQLDVSATAGSANSNSAQDTTVKGALTSRNSFVGFSSPTWGAVKIGKTDAPYKNSTQRMNPFSGMPGDYATIMGNTGGDNRVEFGTRLDHAIWYESPNIHGFTFNALVSPGQNRGWDNSTQAMGESDCTGGNVPGSGGTPAACNDGSYGTAYSANIAYTHGPLYVTAAYELHRNVNRTSDVMNTPAALASADGTDPNDVGNEWAFKVGAQYTFSTATTISGIYEWMRREIPAYLEAQNERSRNGFWLAITQVFSPKDSASFGWAHAGSTPGDPGQHNTAPADPNAIGIANPPNAANMFTFLYRHQFDKYLSVYANYAFVINEANAHYALGAGGRSVTYDCHDGSSISQGAPFCFAGGHPMAVSVGVNYKF